MIRTAQQLLTAELAAAFGQVLWQRMCAGAGARVLAALAVVWGFATGEPVSTVTVAVVVAIGSLLFALAVVYVAWHFAYAAAWRAIIRRSIGQCRRYPCP